MSEELNNLKKQNVFELVKASDFHHRISLKWVLRKKLDGRLRARLVCRGYQQMDEEISPEIASPVPSLTSLKLFISYCARLKLTHLIHLDVVTAFLNAILHELVIVDLPPGFEDLYPIGSALRLTKALYGLRQSPLLWHRELTDFLISLGYKQHPCEPCIFRRSESDILLVWVDDIITTSKSTAEEVGKRYQVRTLGFPAHFLGLNLSIMDDGITISLSDYIERIAKENGLENSKQVYPTQDLHQIEKSFGPMDKYADVNAYQHLLGTISWICNFRPEYTFMTNVLARHSRQPAVRHLKALTSILINLFHSRDLGLLYRFGDSNQISIYSDASEDVWIDGKPTLGMVILMGSTPIYWRSRKAGVVGRSSAASEFLAIADAIEESRIIRALDAFLSGDDVKSTPNPIVLMTDSSSAKLSAEQLSITKRMKSVQLSKYFVKEAVASKEVNLLFVKSQDNVADIYTKVLPAHQFSKLCQALNLVHVPIDNG
jgi:hypothetical protein